jgi:DNA-binding NtrC family response regulator
MEVSRMNTRTDANALIGQSAAFQRVLQAARMVAPTQAPVMLKGPAGSGRSRIAREIHALGASRQGPFVALNGGLLDRLDPLLAAAGGTLFIADVDQLVPELQAGLQSFLHTGKLQEQSPVMRVIVSVGEQVLQRVERGDLREDLYYRLNVVPLEIPSLRQRTNDIPLLLKAFIGEFARQYGRRAPQVGVAARNLLKAYAWPGNVRELRNLAERMVILLPGQTIRPENLPAEMHGRQALSDERVFRLPEEGVDLNALEAEILRQALDLAGGNRSKAARLLKISRDTFLYRLQKFSVEA